MHEAEAWHWLRCLCGRDAGTQPAAAGTPGTMPLMPEAGAMFPQPAGDPITASLARST